MKVWIVFRGSYSDRGTAAVFLNKEAADNYVENNRGRSDTWDEMDIEEWEAGDECARVDRQVWEVCMTKYGEAVPFSAYDKGDPARRKADTHEEQEPALIDRLSLDTVVLWVIREARSAEHIVKIANEIRMQWLATGEWERREAEYLANRRKLYGR